MKTLIPCLDHGFVRLVSYMQPVPERFQEWNPDGKGGGFVDNRLGRPLRWTGDLEIIRSARVSHNADWRTGQDDGKDEKLISHLITNSHTSPFESMVFTFEVKAPLFIFRQWHRHRTWSYNEVSARYTELPNEFYVPKPGHIGTASKTNKQGRDLSEDSADETAQDNLISNQCSVDAIHQSCVSSFEVYKELLAVGVPRELARAVLPTNIYSRMFATVDLHNLMHFLRLRLHHHAQYEIQVYARALLDLVKPICPVTLKHLESELFPTLD